MRLTLDADVVGDVDDGVTVLVSGDAGDETSADCSRINLTKRFKFDVKQIFFGNQSSVKRNKFEIIISWRFVYSYTTGRINNLTI